MKKVSWRATELSVLMMVATLVLTAAADDAPQALATSPLSVRADEMQIDLNRERAELQGNVKLSLGELSVTCPQVELAYEDTAKVRWARGKGGVRARFQDIVAEAQRVQLDAQAGVLKLDGTVRLKQGGGWVKAASASLDLKTRRVSLRDVRGSIPIGTAGR